MLTVSVEKQLRITNRFNRTPYVAFDFYTHSRYERDFVVKANSCSVEISGGMELKTSDDLELFIDQLREAWGCHESLESGMMPDQEVTISVKDWTESKR